MDKACQSKCDSNKEITTPRQAIQLLICTNHTHKRIIEKRTTITELHRTQHRMLMHISKYENIPSQKEIAEHFEISPAAVAVTLKKLEADGYVERTRGTDGDTRHNTISITEKGRREINETRDFFDYVDNTMFRDFTDEEFSTFVALLQKANSNLRSLDATCEDENH